MFVDKSLKATQKCLTVKNQMLQTDPRPKRTRFKAMIRAWINNNLSTKLTNKETATLFCLIQIIGQERLFTHLKIQVSYPQRMKIINFKNQKKEFTKTPQNTITMRSQELQSFKTCVKEDLTSRMAKTDHNSWGSNQLKMCIRWPRHQLNFKKINRFSKRKRNLSWKVMILVQIR